MNKELLILLLSITALALVVLGFLLFAVLYIIWGLRRVMGAIQARIGPNRVGPQGLFQTVADALKLLHKEDIIPCGADRLIFTIAPAIVFIPAYLVYVVMPWAKGLNIGNLNIGVLYVFAISSIAIIGILMGGWASNNKWALLGGFRAAAQLVAYEVPLVLAMAVPILFSGSLSLQEIVQSQAGGFWNWHIFNGFGLVAVAFLLYFTAGLAEINHTPFDIMEAESELVAGFNVEYSGMKFALFFLEEFIASFTLSAIAVALFLGGYHAPFSFMGDQLTGIPGALISLVWFLIKSFVLVVILMWVRSTLPRVRVDQLMNLGWKVMIPVGLIVVMMAGLVVALV